MRSFVAPLDQLPLYFLPVRLCVCASVRLCALQDFGGLTRLDLRPRKPLTLTLAPREPAAQEGRGDKFSDWFGDSFILRIATSKRPVFAILPGALFPCALPGAVWHLAHGTIDHKPGRLRYFCSQNSSTEA